MASENSNWTYNEFLAFLLVYAGGMDTYLSDQELEFIKQRTRIDDIAKIKAAVDAVSDAEVLDIIDAYRPKYLGTPEKELTVKTDLENLINTPGVHSQLEKAAVHILEKIILSKAG